MEIRTQLVPRFIWQKSFRDREGNVPVRNLAWGWSKVPDYDKLVSTNSVYVLVESAWTAFGAWVVLLAVASLVSVMPWLPVVIRGLLPLAAGLALWFRYLIWWSTYHVITPSTAMPYIFLLPDGGSDYAVEAEPRGNRLTKRWWQLQGLGCFRILRVQNADRRVVIGLRNVPNVEAVRRLCQQYLLLTHEMTVDPGSRWLGWWYRRHIVGVVTLEHPRGRLRYMYRRRPA